MHAIAFVCDAIAVLLRWSRAHTAEARLRYDIAMRSARFAAGSNRACIGVLRTPRAPRIQTWQR